MHFINKWRKRTEKVFAAPQLPQNCCPGLLPLSALTQTMNEFIQVVTSFYVSYEGQMHTFLP